MLNRLRISVVAQRQPYAPARCVDIHHLYADLLTKTQHVRDGGDTAR